MIQFSKKRIVNVFKSHRGFLGDLSNLSSSLKTECDAAESTLDPIWSGPGFDSACNSPCRCCHDAGLYKACSQS